jgi:hypothetical protein
MDVNDKRTADEHSFAQINSQKITKVTKVSNQTHNRFSSASICGCSVFSSLKFASIRGHLCVFA